MLMGVKFHSNPSKNQKIKINQWMGCSRFIWNAKCEENNYLTQFSKNYLPIGTYPPIDQTYSQYKNKELSFWLYDCPSQILRNSSVNWYKTYKNYQKGLCKKPKKKKKHLSNSIYLTRELFQFEKCKDGNIRLFIGTKKNNIGHLSIKTHKNYGIPNSITIKRNNGRYTVSFCYDDHIKEEDLITQKEHLEYLKSLSSDYLGKITIGIDRGVKRPIQAGDTVYDLTEEQKRKKRAKEKYIKRCQKRLSHQKK